MQVRKMLYSLWLAASLLAAFAAGPVFADEQRLDELGGDDIFIDLVDESRFGDMDIASNGDIYAALEFGDLYTGEARIEVMRSQDGGDSWQPWGTFDAAGSAYYTNASIHVAEGAQSFCFLACESRNSSLEGSIVVAHSPLSAPGGDWTEVVAMPAGVDDFSDPMIVSDACNFDPYYLYLVASGGDGNGKDIWFTRSTDLGATFETPYKIGSITVNDRRYRHPRICYGFGGYVHVVWFYEHDEHAFDSAARYRRASSYAGGGITAWDPIQHLSSTTDGYEDRAPLVAAALDSDDVLVAHYRYSGEWPNWENEDPVVYHSDDAGATFANSVIIADGLPLVSDLAWQPGSGGWLLSGHHGYTFGGLQRASGTDPLQWTPPSYFADETYSSNRITSILALDPSRDHRIAALWTVHSASFSSFVFDAEWRGDPGYPNFAEYFPRPLDHTPNCPPTLVDLNGDGELEILYTDSQRYIRARRCTGGFMSMWIFDTGAYLSDGPPAVGVLDSTGELYVAVGTIDGRAYLYDEHADLVPGWPVDVGTGQDTYVSIGALGDRYPRTVVIASGDLLTFRDVNGQMPPNAYGRQFGSGAFCAPAAIGDVDGDEIAEVVCGAGNRVFAFKLTQLETVFMRYLDSDVCAAITLGDVDLDGDVEALVPTTNGTLYALDDTGGDLAGDWPFVSFTGCELTSAAIAQMLGTFEPEIAVAARDYTVHLIAHDGVEPSGYPQLTEEPWFILASPLIAKIDGSSDVIVGSRDKKIWSWDNLGNRNPGWPKDLESRINVTPAYGDIDNDGLAEVVILTTDQLAVLDLNQSLNSANRTWPMYGYDPQHTGCANCPEYFTPSAAPEAVGGVTSLSLRATTLGLRQGAVSLHYALPANSAVDLAVYDIQGRRLCTVFKKEQTAGSHAVVWSGRDSQGNPAGAGSYLARLCVRSGGGEEVRVRKIILLP